jgi:hypothetical protein
MIVLGSYWEFKELYRLYTQVRSLVWKKLKLCKTAGGDESIMFMTQAAKMTKVRDVGRKNPSMVEGSVSHAGIASEEAG